MNAIKAWACLSDHSVRGSFDVTILVRSTDRGQSDFRFGVKDRNESKRKGTKLSTKRDLDKPRPVQLTTPRQVQKALRDRAV